MNIRFRTRSHAPVALLALGLLAVAQPSVAASPCKGIAQEACVADAQCAWVEGYTRKDGRTVAAHCKLKPRKPGMEQASLGLGAGAQLPSSGR